MVAPNNFLNSMHGCSAKPIYTMSRMKMTNGSRQGFIVWVLITEAYGEGEAHSEICKLVAKYCDFVTTIGEPLKWKKVLFWNLENRKRWHDKCVFYRKHFKFDMTCKQITCLIVDEHKEFIRLHFKTKRSLLNSSALYAEILNFSFYYK